MSEENGGKDPMPAPPSFIPSAGRKLCGALEPDGVTDDGCAVRLLACGALERAGCAAGEKLGIDGEPD